MAAPIPLTPLGEDAAALRRTIACSLGPVIDAGHAYVGAVTGTTNNERVKALVNIAALASDEGETVAYVFYCENPHPKAPQPALDADGFTWAPDASSAGAIAQNATAEQFAWWGAVQRPIAVKCIQELATSPAWKTKSAWYLIAEEDRMINPKAQRFMAERMKATIRSHAVDHTPLLGAPDKATRLEFEAAKAALA